MPVDISEQRVTRQLLGDQPGVEILATHLAYEPYILGSVSVLFADAKSGSAHEELMAFAAPAAESSRIIAWGEQQLAELNLKDLAVEPAEGALLCDAAPQPDGDDALYGLP